MADFLITQLFLYPWFAPLLVFFAAMGVGYAAVWAYKVQAAAFAWLGYRRQVWAWKAAVRRVGDNGDRLCPSCAVMAEKATGTDHLLEDDPPEYQHPDGDDDLYAGFPEPDENWIEELFPLGKARCSNRDCFLYGESHPGACDVAPTMPAACYLEGPAMPPQPVREFLHPATLEHLEAAGFSRHETNQGAVDSMFTRAQAREVEAMITDGIIPTGLLDKGKSDD